MSEKIFFIQSSIKCYLDILNNYALDRTPSLENKNYNIEYNTEKLIQAYLIDDRDRIL